MATAVAFGCPDFLHKDGLLVAMTHHFFHVNPFHLAINCFSLWVLLGRGEQKWMLVAAYICATASWFASSADPAGASNFIFALLGLKTPSLRDRWWRTQTTIIFITVTIFMGLLPQVSAVTHIVSFVLGCVCASVARKARRHINDYNRAAGIR